MCNLNILIKNKKTKKIYELINFLGCATTESYLYNFDGDGAYFDYSQKLIRDKNKIPLNEYSEDILKSRFILTHQRLTTHGKSFKNTQPFYEDGFVFLHNGILYDYDFKNGRSDSYNFFQEFLKVFNQSKKKTREQNILNGLSLLQKTDGSFSIALLDTKTNRLYYVKNTNPTIRFYRTKDKQVLFITTREGNKHYFKLYTNQFEELNIFSNKIYRIYFSKDKIFLKPIIELKQEIAKKSHSKAHYVAETTETTPTRTFPNKIVNFFRKEQTQSTLLNPDSIINFEYFKAYYGFYKGINQRKCNICGDWTINRNRHNTSVVYCDGCISNNHNLFVTKFKEDNPTLFYV